MSKDINAKELDVSDSKYFQDMLENISTKLNNSTINGRLNKLTSEINEIYKELETGKMETKQEGDETVVTMSDNLNSKVRDQQLDSSLEEIKKLSSKCSENHNKF